jgi:hypothetical protein
MPCVPKDTYPLFFSEIFLFVWITEDSSTSLCRRGVKKKCPYCQRDFLTLGRSFLHQYPPIFLRFCCKVRYHSRVSVCELEFREADISRYLREKCVAGGGGGGFGT